MHVFVLCYVLGQHFWHMGIMQKTLRHVMCVCVHNVMYMSYDVLVQHLVFVAI